ncbi:MAG: cytochrome b N-terminal domain-containing protein [Candidatus Bathyarchaeota archaeon]
MVAYGLHKRTVSKHTVNFTYFLGGITLTCLAVLLITGIVLAIFYVPDTNLAYESVASISSQFFLGEFFRSLHLWSTHAVIIVLILHLARGFLVGTYKHPREFTWLSGVGLLLIVFSLALTGSPLSLDVEGYGATYFIADIFGVFLTGDIIIQSVFAHFFFLPLALGLLLIAHIYQIRKYGLSGPILQLSNGGEKPTYEREIPYFPNYLINRLVTIMIVLVVLVVLSAVFPLPLGDKILLGSTVEMVKPHWWLLWLFVFQRLMPTFAGFNSLILIGIIVILGLLPFLDRGKERHPSKRKYWILVFSLALAGFIMATIYGALLPI